MNKLMATFIYAASALSLCAFPSQPRLFSSIGAAKNEAVNVSPLPCNYFCLKELLDQDRVFSFLARYENSEETAQLRGEYHRLAAFFNVDMPMVKDGERIAILLPSETIGRYSTIVTNSVSAYLLNRNKSFEMRVFDSIDESPQNLERAIKEIESEGFTRALAALTIEGAQTAANMRPSIELYIPTVNRSELRYAPDNFYFGAIDYAKQLEALSLYSNRDQISVFDEPLALSQKITLAADAILPIMPAHITVSAKANYQQLFRANKIAQGSSMLLNTRPDKTIVILSQVTFSDLRLASILSTQINYNPLLLTQMQNEDVKDFYIASSIGTIDNTLRDVNLLLRNNSESDPRFSWMVYASTALAAVITQRNTGNYSTFIELFGLDMKENQIQYPVNIYQIKNSRFVLAPPPNAEGAAAQTRKFYQNGVWQEKRVYDEDEELD